jgi:hypothetical protein
MTNVGMYFLKNSQVQFPPKKKFVESFKPNFFQFFIFKNCLDFGFKKFNSVDMGYSRGFGDDYNWVYEIVI